MVRTLEQTKTSSPAFGEIRQEAYVRFGDRCREGPPRIHLLDKGGSDRKFYRAEFPDGSCLIAVRHGNEREENALYAELARFLAARSVPVPAVFWDAPGWIWMEDLGATDLWSRRRAPWEERKALYESAISDVANLHRIPLATFAEAGISLSPAFDEGLYRWEQDYFFENGLGRLLGMNSASREKLRAQLPLHELAAELAAHPRVPIHRDFQSQNVMVRDGAPVFIDFQGMRGGLGAYDVASLLYDPYTELSEEERRELSAHYLTVGGHVPPGIVFDELLDRCAVQRLMQAMGAFGFLGLVKGKPAFLAHATPAARRLATISARIPGFEPLAQPLKKFVSP